MRSTEMLRSPVRISSVDIFRAFAILPVVIYHFNGFLPFGYLGVDLFFVISGLLVGSMLIRKFRNNEQINFWRFFLQRGFKIWPSYYWFLGAGSILAFVFYSESRPGYIIGGGGDILRYIFFYQNYTGPPYHWPFDHIWSLCVEEHFYIMLPLVMIFIRRLFGNNKNVLLLAAALLIIAGVLFKFINYNFTKSTDTYSRSQNRIDALGWGVMLGILVTYYDSRLRSLKYLPLLFPAGLLIFSFNILAFLYWKNNNFNNVFFHSVAPFCFFLMLLGVYYRDFKAWKPLRFISYYSYNWYLWHPIFVLVCSRFFGITWRGLVLYMLISFLTAMIFTILIEEKFLGRREAILARIFKQRKSNIKSAA